MRIKGFNQGFIAAFQTTALWFSVRLSGSVLKVLSARPCHP